MSLLEHKSFIKGISPFDKLDEHDLDKVVQNFDIAYFKEDETILKKDAMPEFLYFIIKGVVQERDEDEVLSIFTKCDFFDPISLIENFSKHDFVTIEESICYLLPRDIFMEVMHKNNSFEQYFFSSISEKLNQASENEQNKELTNFMVARIKDAYVQSPLIVDYKSSIVDAVKKMKELKVDTLLVDRDDKLGIVTDIDFREKFILQNLCGDDSVDKLATYGLVEIHEDEFLFNAQLKMTKHGIKRLVVRDDDNNLVGVLEQISLVSFFASHTYAISNEIELSSDVKSLKIASLKLIRVIKTLYAKGVKVRYIAKLISQLNEKIFQKLFLLTAPVSLLEKSVFIVMGSEGRQEQILKTDQDNALILSNDCDISKDELEKFTNFFIDTLVDFGYPRCQGNIMISNPTWVMSEDEAKENISTWLDKKDDDSFMKMAILYDALAVYGDVKLLDRVKDYLYNKIDTDSMFFSHFSKPVLSFETPLGLFTSFKSEHNMLDIKKGGLFAIVHGVRSLSLQMKLTDTNSVARLKKLNDKGVIDRELTSDLIESFTFFMTLRLKSNLEHIDRDEDINNLIDIKKLSKTQKDLLKDAFKTVDRFKKFLIFHYKLNLLG
jgi:CBS domain-containing protein